jgi:hypothetical protein
LVYVVQRSGDIGPEYVKYAMLNQIAKNRKNPRKNKKVMKNLRNEFMIFKQSNGQIQRKCHGLNIGVKNSKIQMVMRRRVTEFSDL